MSKVIFDLLLQTMNYNSLWSFIHTLNMKRNQIALALLIKFDSKSINLEYNAPRCVSKSSSIIFPLLKQSL